MEISKAKISLYSSLSQVKMRRRHGLFAVEGEKGIADLTGHFTPEAILCVEGYEIPPRFQETEKVLSVSVAQMAKISNLSTPSPVMGIFKIPEAGNVSALTGVKGLCVALDGIQDPGNLGTIIRTCHWFGIYRIFASKDTVDIYNPKTVQATMGSLGRVEVIYCDLAELFANNPGMPVYGMLLDGKDIFKATLREHGFILLGNEGKGISAPLRGCVTDALLIPPGGPDHSESLNVAIAAAVTITCFRSKSL